jgi:catechol 2,3-dioxygenase-like lactoylglutathione lyase family enzyme
MTEDHQPLVTVVGFDHLVLIVADVEASLAFYLGLLGLAPVRVDEWRRGEVLFPSARVDVTTIIDFLQAPADGRNEGRNLDHLCLVVEPTDLDALKASGQVTVVDGPGVRYGAQGNGTSLYVLDPDGTVVELRHY